VEDIMSDVAQTALHALTRSPMETRHVRREPVAFAVIMVVSLVMEVCMAEVDNDYFGCPVSTKHKDSTVRA
jgi:hypothetical protein